MRTLRLTLWTA